MLMAAALAACTSHIADMPVAGVPEAAPERPETAPAYPAVHDMPPPRDGNRLSADELRDAEAELVAARNRQTTEEQRKSPTKRPGKAAGTERAQ